MTKRSTLITLAIFGPLTVITAVLLFSAAANAPSKAAIIITKKEQPLRVSINMSPTMISNAYASFDYPAALKQTPNGGLSRDEVAAYTFVYRDIETWSLAIEIVSVPSGEVSDNSAFQLRKANPQIYQETQYTMNNQPVVVMTDKTYGGFSKVAFLAHGQYQAVISLYGDDPNGLNDLQKTFNMILNSWQWNNG